MRAHLLSVILLLSFLTAAQANDSEQQRDSLRMVIAASSGEEKLIAYRQLLFLYLGNLSDDASWTAMSDFADEYMKFAEKENNIKHQSAIRVNYLIGALRANRLSEAEKKAPETLAFLKSKGMTEAYFVAYKQFILQYCRQGLFEKALAELQKVYAEAGRQNDPEAQFYMQYLMGMTYMYQDRLTEAEDHYRQSIATAEKMSRKPFDLLVAYQEVCNMLQATERFDEFFKLAKQTDALLEQLEKENPDRGYTHEKNNLWSIYAYAYCAIKEFDKAEYYCNLMDSLYGKDAVAQSNTLSARSSIAESRKEWDKAIEYVNRALEIDPTHLPLRLAKVRILAGSENASLTWAETDGYVAFADSMRTASFNARLDELRTQYDVDRHVAEKERNRIYFLFALAGCLLLAVALGIWIYFNRKIAGKNRVLTEQIRELTAQQEVRDKELLSKTSFVAPEVVTDSDDDSDILCPESRKDKLCREIRDFILLDKAYRNPNINRDYVIDHLGTNRELFVDAFMACFGMSFTEYINGLRLKDAVTLLEQSDLSIEDISLKTGFGTIRTFQRQFQSKFHITPKEFRNAARKGK